MSEELTNNESGALLWEDFKVIRNSPSRYYKNRRTLPLLFVLLLMTPFTVFGFLNSLEYLPKLSDQTDTSEAVRPKNQAIPIGNKVIYGETRQVILEPEVKFRGPSATEAWHSLFPTGRGFIQVAKEDSGGLGPPVRSEDQQGYCISAFHQLHCLTAIHTAYWQSSDNRSVEMIPHIEHCFDYLRQLIMCAADTTLEHAQEGNEDTGAVVGWGIGHQCRDWNVIWQFAEDHAMYP